MGETKILYLLHLVLRRIQQCNAGLLADPTAFIAVANLLRARLKSSLSDIIRL
jgi:hypothetical protein